MTQAEPADRQADWLRPPSLQEFTALYPRAAFDKSVRGDVELDCYVGTDGVLRDCKVVSETPGEMGFGRAAVAMTPPLRMRPAMRDGQAVGARVTIPFAFPKLDQSVMASTREHNPLLALAPVSLIAWAEAPTFSEALQIFPKAAIKRRLSGFAAVDCAYAQQRLAECRVLYEDPKGVGFGAAALSLTPKFAAQDGHEPDAERVRLNFQFPYRAFEGPDPAVGRPPWLRRPDADMLRAAFPAAARQAGVSKVRVVMKCRVGSGGTLASCVAESEEPAGHGVATATLGLADRFRMNSWRPDGLPVIGGVVRISILYDLGVQPSHAGK